MTTFSFRNSPHSPCLSGWFLALLERCTSSNQKNNFLNSFFPRFFILASWLFMYFEQVFRPVNLSMIAGWTSGYFTSPPTASLLKVFYKRSIFFPSHSESEIPSWGLKIYSSWWGPGWGVAFHVNHVNSTNFSCLIKCEFNKIF